MARTMQPHNSMRTQTRRFRSAGFSLVEMLIVVVLIGLMSLFGFPRVVRVFNQSQVRGARQAVLNKYNAARIQARQSSRHTFLVRSGNVLWIEREPRMVGLAGSTRDTVGEFLNLEGSWLVAVRGFTEVEIDPRGLTVGGGPWQLVIARQEASDSILITGFGRVTR